MGDDEGHFWSLDNRRLGAFKVLQALRNEMVLVPCCVHLLSDGNVSRKVLAAYKVKKKTDNGGLGIDFSETCPAWSRSVSRSLSRRRRSTSPVRGRTASTSLRTYS